MNDIPFYLHLILLYTTLLLIAFASIICDLMPECIELNTALHSNSLTCVKKVS